MPIQLKQLISQLEAMLVEGSTDREITGISYDSRRITPGMLFVAIRGHHVDGHEFINNAIDRGAAGVICEQNGFVPQRATKIKVADSRIALAIVAAAFFQQPSSKLKIIGVTGTNGKTTVAFLVKHILEKAGIPTGLIGTVRYEIGDRVFPAQRTTPEALEVQQMLAQMLRAGCRACVMEVSSHALTQNRVHGVQFDAAIFTNLTRDHLDYHNTMESYFAAKKLLFNAVEQGTKRGGVIINIDDAFGQKLNAESRAQVRITYGLSEPAQLRATNIRLTEKSTAMRVEWKGSQFDCEFPLIGRHNVYNALAAVGAAGVLEVDLPSIREALNSTEPVPGRLESVPSTFGFGIYVDYAHTDDALQNVLSTLREFTRGRVLLTFGCGGNRDSGKRARMGQVAARLADYTIITSDNPRKESAAQIAEQIAEGFRAMKSDQFRVELDRKKAIEEIIRMAQPSDSVLIAGKGHETYQEFEDTVIPFDDRVYARETVEAMSGRIPKRDYASRH